MENTMTQKTWTEKEIVALLETNLEAVYRGILAIDARQTASERMARYTVEANGMGWSQYDANFGGWLAGEIRGGRKPYTPGMRAKARALAKRYRKQLVAVANRNETSGRNEAVRVAHSVAALSGAPVSKAETARLAAEVLAGLRASAAANGPAAPAPAPLMVEWGDEDEAEAADADREDLD
jgi:hypothetical protein